MEKLKIYSNIEFCQIGELDNNDRRLVELAMEATDNSYSPYSKFRVGAAVRLSDGKIIKGANQENAAFSVTICEERSAIFAAQANYPEQPITTLAIAARNVNGMMPKPITPCGACRQVILEIEERYRRPVRILLYGTEGVYIVSSVRDLLPLCFVDSSMG